MRIRIRWQSDKGVFSITPGLIYYSVEGVRGVMLACFYLAIYAEWGREDA